MALNVTVGSANADSMATLQEANTYMETFFASDPGLTSWGNLEVSAQEDIMRMAATFFNYLPLRGLKVFIPTEESPDTPEQAMPFPRTIQTDTTMIPKEVKDAQIEIAFSIIYRTILSRASITSGVATSSQVKKLGLGGLLSIEFSNTGENSGSIMEQFTRGINSLTWLRISKYIGQIRGATI